MRTLPVETYLFQSVSFPCSTPKLIVDRDNTLRIDQRCETSVKNHGRDTAVFLLDFRKRLKQV